MVTKISAKDFNPSRLQEELASLPITSIGWAGFERASDRRYTPAAARRKVGESVSGGTRTEDFADPGELRFSTSRDLSAAEQTTLDGILAVHVHTILTAEQQRQDQDQTDLNQLATDFGGWDAMSTNQRMQVLKRTLRILLRRERGATI